MAIVQGVFKGYRGLCGNLVFIQRKGVQIIRSRGIPSNFSSDLQTARKDKFKKITGVFRYCTPEWIPPFWQKFARHPKSGWGQMIKTNIPLQDGVNFDINKMLVSSGKLPNVIKPKCTYTPGTGMFNFTWLSTDLSITSNDDFVSVLLVNSFNYQTVAFAIATRLRRDLSLELQHYTGQEASDFFAFICTSGNGIASGQPYTISNSVALAVDRP